MLVLLYCRVFSIRRLTIEENEVLKKLPPRVLVWRSSGLAGFNLMQDDKTPKGVESIAQRYVQLAMHVHTRLRIDSHPVPGR